jgi:dTDP-4-dehydrorhamnose reductase
MKILITGGSGMLGKALQHALCKHELIVPSHQELDVTSLQTVRDAVRAARPDVVIHSAAMTAVDLCETDKDVAWSTNAAGSRNVAIACQSCKSKLIAISTDYVFSGESERPYHEFDETRPVNVYGCTKLAGEDAIRAECPDHIIVRLGWLYGAAGHNFVRAVLKSAAQQEVINVVDDQSGNPTSTKAACDCIASLLGTAFTGTIHATCEGGATRFEFAKAILQNRHIACRVNPCKTSEYPRAAARPANAQLEKRVLKELGLAPMPDWRDELCRFLREC